MVSPAGLEQTELYQANNISLNLLASERKTVPDGARHRLPVSITTHLVPRPLGTCRQLAATGGLSGLWLLLGLLLPGVSVTIIKLESLAFPSSKADGREMQTVSRAQESKPMYTRRKKRG